MEEKQAKSHLPGLTQLFRFTVVIGLVRGVGATCQMFGDYAVFWGSEYAGLAAVDIGLHLIELAMYVGMLVYIALRKRTFLICFWADVGCRVVTLLVVLFSGGNAVEFLTPLLLPLIWASYFYLSDHFSDAFDPYREPLLLRVLRGTADASPPQEKSASTAMAAQVYKVPEGYSSQASASGASAAPAGPGAGASAVPASTAASDTASEPPAKQ